jgi:zinc/manganese transport system substrate-binding protein
MLRTVLVCALLGAVVGACGSDDDDGVTRVVATTSILGDVVTQLVGDANVDVDVLMPAGVDPHDFAPSARQVAAMRDADLLVVNGLGFEAGVEDAIEAAASDGVEVVTATDAVEAAGLVIDDDPHVFTDPERMQAVAEAVADALGVSSERYVEQLEALDAEIEDALRRVPEERRVLVTNHDVFAYFADHFGFEVLGVVIPGGSTLAEASAADLADLAANVEDAGVPAVFADTSSPRDLADALAREVGADIEVVELYSESLGEEGSGADTYIGMMRTNAERIAEALAPP